MEEPLWVQSLAQAGISEVPSQYIQPPQSRASLIEQSDIPTYSVNPIMNIPIIDLSQEKDSLLNVVGRACREWGAFHVLNHGVTNQLMDRMKSVAFSFFNDLPMADKLKYACSGSSAASEGYGSRMLVSTETKTDTILDWRDYFDHHTLPPSRRNHSRWPNFPNDYRQVVTQYSDEMDLLGKRLLGLLSESLGLKASFIQDAVGEFYQNITASYYPPCPQPELTLGLQAHSDMGTITLLIQDDVGGLEVLKDNKWVPAHPLANAILVLVADQTEIITNGKYKSAVHRAVTNNHRARLSVATFHDPAKSVKIGPASQLVADSFPPRYRAVVYGEYVSSWYSKGPEGKRNLDLLVLS